MRTTHKRAAFRAEVCHYGGTSSALRVAICAICVLPSSVYYRRNVSSGKLEYRTRRFFTFPAVAKAVLFAVGYPVYVFSHSVYTPFSSARRLLRRANFINEAISIEAVRRTAFAPFVSGGDYCGGGVRSRDDEAALMRGMRDLKTLFTGIIFISGVMERDFIGLFLHDSPLSNVTVTWSAMPYCFLTESFTICASSS